jgi:tetratricopeptide (TPR) repeat protein
MKSTLKQCLIILLLASLLAACGPTIGPSEKATATPAAGSGSFDKGNEYLQAGMAALMAGEAITATTEFNKAIAAFEAVVAEDPKQVSALTNLGVAYYNVGRLDDAIAQYQKALELAPDDADIHSNLAAAYVQKAQAGGSQPDKAQLQKAAAEYTRAVTIDPELAQAHFGLGVVYLILGQNASARDAFESFLKYDDGQDPIATEQANQYLEQLKNQ